MTSILPYSLLKNLRGHAMLKRKALYILSFILLLRVNGYGQLPIADGVTSTENYPKNPASKSIFPGDTTVAGSVTGDTSLLNNEPLDEISITLNVQRIGSLEISAIIYGQDAYLPVKDIFDFLKIQNQNTPELNSLSGFFIHPTASYLIDQARHRILYQGKIIDLGSKGIILTETNLYLRSDYFGNVFGLECSFNFRSLSVTLSTKIELPAIRQMQQELMRRNISRLKGEKKADTTIQAGFSLFRPGMADWSFIHTKESGTVDNTRAGLALGAMLAGGEAHLYLNYNSDQKFTERQQFYSWKYVNNANTVIRQFTAGKIYSQSVSSVFSPIRGIQVSNTPTVFRRSFGTYRLSNNTEPGWMVELYVNNVMVNYMKADASGFFSFDVPMVYGNSVVQLRFYGPWGEERIREQTITIPFNFLPLHQLEYSLTAGVVDDDQKDKYSRGTLNYGLGRHITIGTGAEYLTSANAGKIMPFGLASIRLGPGLLISGEHMYGVRTKGVLSYHLPSNLQFDLNYTKYTKSQTSVKLNYLEEKKAALSIPFSSKKFNAFSRITLNQYTSLYEKITSSEFLLSSVIAGMSSNLTTYAIFKPQTQPLVYTSVSMIFRLPRGIRFTPQVQYEYEQKNLSMMKFELQKNLTNRGFFNLAYEKDLITQVRSVTAGIRYNFSFGQAAFAVRKRNTGSTGKDNNGLSLSQAASGSIIYDDRSGKITASNQNNVGKGGLVFLPFLDLNCDGHRQANEPAVSNLKLRINGGRLEQDKKDSTIRVLGLEAYTPYFVELDKFSFDNIAWQIRNSTMNVVVEPDHLKRIEIPVLVLGEVSGTVYLKNAKEQKGLARIIVNIYNSSSVLVAKTLTEDDGYFSYIGLAPGNYVAGIDAGQKNKLRMSATANIPFSIRSNREGDVVDGLEFVLKNESKRSDN